MLIPRPKVSPALRLALFIVAILFACNSVRLAAQAPLSDNQPATAGTNESSAQTSPPSGASLHLGPGDLVEMSAYNVPELNTKSRVTSKGEVYFPFIGYTHVAGLTTEEAQELIQKRLGEYLKNPSSLFIRRGVCLAGRKRPWRGE